MRHHSMKIPTMKALAVCGVWLFAADEAFAGLTLTAAGTSQGFGLSTFASGFATSGSIGPLGIAFPSSGGVLVSDQLGNVRRFATDTDGQLASSAPIGQNYGGGNSEGLAQVGGNIYMAQGGNGRIVQINSDGSFNQVIVGGFGTGVGLVADPANGHLFVSTRGDNQIYDINPITKTSTLFLTGVPNPDGLGISADGTTLYVAATNTGHILGYNIASKALTFDSGAINGGIDGTALGTGTLAGFIFANLNNGSVVEINLATDVQTIIASGGSRGDFVMADPSNGSLLLTQTDSIVRLIAPSGGGFGSVPEPSSLLLLMMGIGGLVIYRRSRRAPARG